MVRREAFVAVLVGSLDVILLLRAAAALTILALSAAARCPGAVSDPRLPASPALLTLDLGAQGCTVIQPAPADCQPCVERLVQTISRSTGRQPAVATHSIDPATLGQGASAVFRPEKRKGSGA